jgi:hypothetical protein
VPFPALFIQRAQKKDDSTVSERRENRMAKHGCAASDQKLSTFFKKIVYMATSELYDHGKERINHILSAMLTLHHMHEL